MKQTIVRFSFWTASSINLYEIVHFYIGLEMAAKLVSWDDFGH
jgi:hypothetical protein